MTDYQEAQERTLRLTHPDLDFCVDVRLRQYANDSWVATADRGDDHDVGVNKDPREAIRVALGALGERYAGEMARDADLKGGPPGP